MNTERHTLDGIPDLGQGKIRSSYINTTQNAIWLSLNDRM